MLDKLDSMIDFHRQVLHLRDQRQQLLAMNIANSDTPNYQARDIDFNTALKKALKQEMSPSVPTVSLTVTAANHIAINTSRVASNDLYYRIPFQSSADNNTVDMDRERVEMADNSIRYQGSLTFLGDQFKQLMSVVQGDK